MTMEQQPSAFGGGLLNQYSGSQSGMNLPGSSSSLNPYLNFDPNYISQSAESQFIFPEGAGQTRGRFELAFSQIGCSIMLGGAGGGLNGLYAGMKSTSAANMTGAIKRTQMINFIAKQGASSAQTLGVIALMYSGFGVLISKARGADDEINTVIAGTSTGLLYKCSAGKAKLLKAGGVGFGLSLGYALWVGRNRIRNLVSDL